MTIRTDRVIRGLLVLGAAWVVGTAGSSVSATQSGPRHEALMRRARDEGTVRVIARVRGSFVPEGSAEPSAARRQRRTITRAQERILDRLSSYGPTAVKRFRHVPFLAMEVDAAALSQLLADPDVLDLEPDRLERLFEENLPEPPGLSSSASVIGAPTAWSAGFTGEGRVVAVLDTGVERTHTFLAGKVLSEACYSSNTSQSASFCPGGVESTTQPGSGVNCDGSIRGCDHGTHVAGIVAGEGASFSGVARDAGIIAIQVFSRFDDPALCEAPCALSWSSDQILALERVYDLRDTFDIAAVNMSLGGGRYTSTSSCDADNTSRKAAIDNLRSVGIATVIAAGNSGYSDALSAPGCISSAVSAGSTTDLGAISGFSNEAEFLSLYAPGQSIVSSVLLDQFETKSGTSMATPHVAGAWAILREKALGADVDTILGALESTGVPVTSTTGTWTTPRIRVDLALDVFPAPGGFFDADAAADLAVWEEADGGWSILPSSAGSPASTLLGMAGDLPVPHDYDGDGVIDVAVYRPGAPSSWLIFQSHDATLRTVALGDAASFPVPADYDGDGDADLAVYRPGSPSTWTILESSTSRLRAVSWGAPPSLPVPADYDGDGRADIAVYLPGSPSRWAILQSSDGAFRFANWGNLAGRPVPADYDGDGRADVAVYRAGTPSRWSILESSNGAYRFGEWGSTFAVAVPADYDGDGAADLAVYKPGNPSVWNILQSSGMTLRSEAWGTSTSWPVSSPMWWRYLP